MDGNKLGLQPLEESENANEEDGAVPHHATHDKGSTKKDNPFAIDPALNLKKNGKAKEHPDPGATSNGHDDAGSYLNYQHQQQHPAPPHPPPPPQQQQQQQHQQPQQQEQQQHPTGGYALELLPQQTAAPQPDVFNHHGSSTPLRPIQPHHHPLQALMTTTTPTTNMSSNNGSVAAGPPPGPPPPSSSGGGKKRKASAMNSEDPESEIRRQAQGLCESSLETVIERVRELGSTGPSLEKSKQLFGMTWLLKNCHLSPDDNVPRNRIYARYVEVCSENDLKSLNPASFGKLVRGLFPDIKTRRLGVRGQSKYHYCGIRLIGDQNNATGNTPIGTPARLNSPGLNDSFSNSPYSTPSQLSRLNNTTTASSLQRSNDFDPKISEFMHSAPGQTSTTATGTATTGGGGVPPQATASAGGGAGGMTPTSTTNTTLFSDISDISLSSSAPEGGFSLPSLEFYYDTSADPDSATTLYGLYRTHCRSLIEALRFMHIKKFLDIQGSFMGSLTSPVRKLLAEPGVVNWIAAVDWATYKEMVQLLSPLALQDVPSEVLHGLRSLCQFLPGHLASVLHNQPAEFLSAKLSAANAFVGLVDRLLRANETAQSAGKMLVNNEELEKMKSSWVNFVDAKTIVAREAPCATDEVERILQQEVVDLLQPTTTTTTDEETTTTNKDKEPQSKSEAAIVKWAQYLSSLPGRFPHVPTRLFLLCVSCILKATLRDIGFNGGNGFGAWWVVQCWIDEWMGWTAEMGGFLSNEKDDSAPAPSGDKTTDFIAGIDGQVKLLFPMLNRHIRIDNQLTSHNRPTTQQHS
ncbi:hypothetical protein TRICI_002876 [Trichomonascus ciferrii]|uniref:RFX-type winged-helix domain-containing protein n=1 Tax=Trichomonascus ciferrii TaxID=44093 RepID=A0A642V5G0_9ASCO|nr:hypothetical protein TRICI_002876 [Trichomonascus ciferrii]